MNIIANIDNSAVVCREHEKESRYSTLKSQAVCICSLPCPTSDPLLCLVCEAARATSAAPTFFPVQKIIHRTEDGNIITRSLCDGGIKFNNPSLEIFYHYTQGNRTQDAWRGSISSTTDITSPSHGNLNLARVRIINLGTGTEPILSQYHQPGVLSNLVPPQIRYLAWLKRTLAKEATSSEETARAMSVFCRTSKIKFERFSEDNGVCYIKMDKYKKLGIIQEKTDQYLNTPSVRDRLRRVARDIARDYLEANYTQESPSRLKPDSRLSKSHGNLIETATYPNTAHSEGSTANTTSREPSTEIPGAIHTSTPAIPPRRSSDIVGPPEPMIRPSESPLHSEVTRA
jgi:hypothetical protein